jgi:hypothetical protein
MCEHFFKETTVVHWRWRGPPIAAPLKKLILPPEHKLRFKAPVDTSTATYNLNMGSANVFGAEMALTRTYAPAFRELTRLKFLNE